MTPLVFHSKTFASNKTWQVVALTVAGCAIALAVGSISMALAVPLLVLFFATRRVKVTVTPERLIARTLGSNTLNISSGQIAQLSLNEQGDLLIEMDSGKQHGLSAQLFASEQIRQAKAILSQHERKR